MHSWLRSENEMMDIWLASTNKCHGAPAETDTRYRRIQRVSHIKTKWQQRLIKTVGTHLRDVQLTHLLLPIQQLWEVWCRVLPASISTTWACSCTGSPPLPLNRRQAFRGHSRSWALHAELYADGFSDRPWLNESSILISTNVQHYLVPSPSWCTWATICVIKLAEQSGPILGATGYKMCLQFSKFIGLDYILPVFNWLAQALIT